MRIVYAAYRTVVYTAVGKVLFIVDMSVVFHFFEKDLLYDSESINPSSDLFQILVSRITTSITDSIRHLVDDLVN